MNASTGTQEAAEGYPVDLAHLALMFDAVRLHVFIRAGWSTPCKASRALVRRIDPIAPGTWIGGCFVATPELNMKARTRTLVRILWDLDKLVDVSGSLQLSTVINALPILFRTTALIGVVVEAACRCGMERGGCEASVRRMLVDGLVAMARYKGLRLAGLAGCLLNPTMTHATSRPASFRGTLPLPRSKRTPIVAFRGIPDVV